MDPGMNEREGLAKAIEGGELALVWCHPQGKFPAEDATEQQCEVVVAALRANAQAAPMSIETLLARVAALICEITCGLTSECRSREAAQALLDGGYLTQPASTVLSTDRASALTVPQPGGAGYPA